MEIGTFLTALRARSFGHFRETEDFRKPNGSFAQVWRHDTKDKSLLLDVTLLFCSHMAVRGRTLQLPQRVLLKGACWSASAWAPSVGVREPVGVAAFFRFLASERPKDGRGRPSVRHFKTFESCGVCESAIR